MCGTGRPGADGEVGKGDIIEPEPFAENSRPGILDLNRGTAHGLVGEEEKVKTGQYSRWQVWLGSANAQPQNCGGWTELGYCGDRGAACGWLGQAGLLPGRIWEWARRDGTGPVKWEGSGVKRLRCLWGQGSNRSHMLRHCEQRKWGVVRERLVVSLAALSQLDLPGSWLLRTGQGSSQFQF